VKLTAALLAAFSLALLPACKDSTSPAPKKASATNAHNHAHDEGDPSDHHGGPVIQLGTAAIGPYQAIATRDQGAIEPGKDAPIDVTITPSEAAAAPIAAVRFWIGTEDARGSVKARADIEDPNEPNRYHTHAEIPAPLPPGSKLWVEVEDTQGGHHIGSFDLNL
jgi:hypothetical protein